MTSQILLVGSGGIGRRHLQSLANCQSNIQITVCDPSDPMREMASQAWLTANGRSPCRFISSLESCPNEVDLAIVATSSFPRAPIIRDVLGRGVKLLILEKFLFPRLDEYRQIEDSLLAAGASAWVNCPRRLYPGCSQLRELLGDAPPRRYSVSGVNWGLACNSVHFLDHWMSLLPEDATIDDFTSGLDLKVYPAKRAGYVEFFGTITMVADDSAFVAVCRADEDVAPSARVELEAADGSIIQIDEQAQILRYGQKSYPYPVPFQSELTSGVVDELLTSGQCKLTPYATSATYHQRLLVCFLDHMEKVEGKEFESCPVT